MTDQSLISELMQTAMELSAQGRYHAFASFSGHINVIDGSINDAAIADYKAGISGEVYRFWIRLDRDDADFHLNDTISHMRGLMSTEDDLSFMDQEDVACW